MRFVYSLTLLIVLSSLMAFAQPKYRTFTQEQLAEKTSRNAGRGIASRVSYVIKNNYDTPMNVLSAHFSSPIITLEDSGGFPSVKLVNYRTTVLAEGKTLQPGDSVILHALVKRIVPGTKITGYQMRMKGTPTATGSGTLKSQKLMPGAGVSTITITHAALVTSVKAKTDQQIYAQPTGGNVFEYLYRKDIKKPAGVTLGIVKPEVKGGWIRTSRSDIKMFPHTGAPRCFDSVLVSTKKKVFSGELKNPSVRAHNNHLLGSLMALKFSMIANDSGMCEPYDPSATPLRWLVYYDSTNHGDRFNNYTVQQLCNLTDSALTYCSRFTSGDYVALDQVLTKILNAFSGEVKVTNLKLMKVEGVKSLSEVTFLHENPAAVPHIPGRKADIALDNIPKENGLLANYPNPFNPTTTVSFMLKENSVVTLKVFNVLGQEVATLLDHADYEAGEFSVDFAANSLPSGAYYYRIFATSENNNNVFSDMKKMILMK